MASYLRPRRGKKATAISQLTGSAALKRGEIFFEVPDTGVGTGAGNLKMGDGTTAYTSLPYFLNNVSDDNAVVSFTDSSEAESDPYTTNPTHIGNIVPTASLKTIFTNLKQLLLNYNSQLTTLNNDLNNNTACTFYVSPTGSDSNDGLTASTPFATIQHAVNLCPTTSQTLAKETESSAFVNTIYLAEGTYNLTRNLVINNRRIVLNGQGNTIRLSGDSTNNSNICIYYNAYLSFTNCTSLFIDSYNTLPFEVRTGAVLDIDETASPVNITNNNTSNDAYGIYANFGRVNIECSELSFEFAGTGSTYNMFGIYARSGSSVTINGCDMTIVTNATNTFCIYSARSATVQLTGTSTNQTIINSSDWKYGVYCRGGLAIIAQNYVTNEAATPYSKNYGGQIFTAPYVDEDTYESDMSTTYQLARNGATKIGDSDDLNNYTTPGNYYASSGHSITNAPVTYTFDLKVARAGSAYIQTLDHGGDNSVRYYRKYTSGGVWTDWAQFKDATIINTPINNSTFQGGILLYPSATGTTEEASLANGKTLVFGFNKSDEDSGNIFTVHAGGTDTTNYLTWVNTTNTSRVIINAGFYLRCESAITSSDARVRFQAYNGTAWKDISRTDIGVIGIGQPTTISGTGTILVSYSATNKSTGSCQRLRMVVTNTCGQTIKVGQAWINAVELGVYSS